MKELSVEEKAKRYDEAIERAEKVLLDCTSEEQKVVEYIYPELYESEDERIRKWIIGVLSIYEHDRDLRNAALAWLEKQGEQKAKYHDVCDKCIRQSTCQSDCFLQQGEQKPADEIERKYNPCYNMSFEEAQEYISNRGFDIPWTDCDVFVDFRYVTQTVANILRWADDNPIQNPAWSEKDEKMYTATIFALAGFMGNEDKIDWLESIKDKVQPKQEWSEEDDNCLSTIIAEFSKCAGKSVSKDEWMRCNDFLNSLRDRGLPQPKQEWSEEDETIAKALTKAANDNVLYGYISKSKLLEWLKSPKHQNTWKPSDEQMNALNDVISSRDIKYDVLSELWKDLKKLIEE